MIKKLILCLTLIFLMLNPDTDVKIRWSPQAGAQTEVMSRKEKEILYGGARYGGKSEAGRYWMADPNYIEDEGFIGVVLRKNSKDLAEWVERTRVAYRPLNAKVTGTPPIIKFPSGAKIYTGHMRDVNSYEHFQGWNIQKMLIEELTQIASEDLYEKIISSVRGQINGNPAQVFCTTNPGGPGHAWVKNRYIDKSMLKTYTDEHGNSRIFIPSTIYDNPIGMKNDPGYLGFLKSIKNKKLREAWLNGSWDTFTGQYFDMWDSDVHVIKPFTLDSGWSRYRGLDWGFTAPACVLWGAVDFVGNHYIYREFYESGNPPHKVAKKVEVLTDEDISATYADPSIRAKNQYGTGKYDEQETAKSIEQLLVDGGLYCTLANNDRQSGWSNIADMLYFDANLKPKLFIFENCANLIRTLPYLVRDESKPEDIDEKQEDHAADALRYMLMHTADSHKPRAEKTPYEQTLDELGLGDDNIPDVDSYRNEAVAKDFDEGI